MKKVLLIVFLSLSILSAKAQQDSGFIARKVIESFQKGDINILKKLVAPPSIYREVFPKETFGASNEEIEAETSESEELKKDFEDILKSAKEKGVDLSKLEFKSIVTKLMMPNVYGTTITFSEGEKRGKLAISALKHNGNWYLMEILITTTVFEDF